jgi:hypothetical protein
MQKINPTLLAASLFTVCAISASAATIITGGESFTNDDAQVHNLSYAGEFLRLAAVVKAPVVAPHYFVDPSTTEEVNIRSSTSLRAVVRGNPAPDLQWQHWVDGGWVDIADAAKEILNIQNFKETDQGRYRLRAENAEGIVYSGESELTLAAQVLNILIFGNSYAHGALGELPEIAAAFGDTANVVVLRGPFDVAIAKELSGDPLITEAEAELLTNSEANLEGWVQLEEDYSKRARVVLTLESTNWDYVALQTGSGEASMLDDETLGIFDKYSPVIDAIQAYAAGNPKVYYYHTTQYRNDSLLYGTAIKSFQVLTHENGATPLFPYTEDYHFLDVYKAGVTFAALKNLDGIVPGGAVLENLRYSAYGAANENFPYPGFDYANTSQTVVPQAKSFHYGMIYNGGVNPITGLEWSGDDHPNHIGNYATGAVYYSIFFGKSPEDCTYFPSQRISEEEANYITRVAHETVQGRMPPLRLYRQSDIDDYNAILNGLPNSQVESVSADAAYNTMTMDIWTNYGSLVIQ